MSLPCDKGDAINYILERVNKMDSKQDDIGEKIDSLFEFKNKILGAMVATTTIGTIIFNIIIIIIKGK